MRRHADLLDELGDRRGGRAGQAPTAPAGPRPGTMPRCSTGSAAERAPRSVDLDIAELDVLAPSRRIEDLTSAARPTGRGPLAELFPRNAERSVCDKPQRNLAMS